MVTSFDTASLGKFLSNDLTIYDQERFYEVPSMDYWAVRGERIPSTDDLPLGAEDIESFRKTNVGLASLWDGRSYDIPLVDMVISGTKASAYMVVIGAEWSMADLERKKLNSRTLPRMGLVEGKMEAMTEAIYRRLHMLILAGLTDAGIYGLFNDPNMAVVDETATTPFQLTTTELNDWFRGLINSFKTTSRLQYSSIVAYVSDPMLAALSTPLPDNTGDTPYMRLTSPERGIYIGAIEPITELSNQELRDLGVTSATDEEYILMGDFRNRSSIRRHYTPIGRTPIGVKDSQLHFGISGYAGSSQPILKVPEKFTRVVYDPTTA